MSQFRPTRIIMHCSDTEDSFTLSWQAIRRYHVEHNKWTDIAYHFGIEKVNDRYETLVGRMLDHQGAHTEGENSDSIGICLVGRFDEHAPPTEQWAIATQLVRALCYIYCISHDHVFGHRDFNSHKTCPGLKFDMVEFRRQLNPY